MTKSILKLIRASQYFDVKGQNMNKAYCKKKKNNGLMKSQLLWHRSLVILKLSYNFSYIY